MKKPVTLCRKNREDIPSRKALPKNPELAKILKRLGRLGTLVPRLFKSFDFEDYRSFISGRLYVEERRSNAGRPPFDCVMMLKILLLQRWHNLTPVEMETVLYSPDVWQFLGIRSYAETPKTSTIWRYRERFAEAGILDGIVHRVTLGAHARGLDIMSGELAADSTFFLVPVQRNSRDENKAIKGGQGGELWAECPAVRRHKDTEARWGSKHGTYVYGYKLHIIIDVRTKMVLGWSVTPGNVHDSKGLEPLLDPAFAGRDLYVDAGYVGMEGLCAEYGIKAHICEKATGGHPLTHDQKVRNKLLSKIRCRVEHAFGFMEQSLHGKVVRTVGIGRAKANLAMCCFLWNMERLSVLDRKAG